MYIARPALLAASVGLISCYGCASTRSRLADVKPPQRPSQLAAYDVFVGNWNWEAQIDDAEPADKHWSGTATWAWTLDNRFLQGTMSAHSERLSFTATGLWGWHPTRKQYTWWLFNDWGFPQEGTARYDEGHGRWIMPYTSVGLDGTKSYGRYEMTVVSHDELAWTMTEWADPFHTIQKIAMTGTYRRR